MPFRQIFAPRNRGLLLDVIVFGVNVISLTVLTHYFIDFLHHTDDHPINQAALVVYCLGLSFLQPIGAVLKRRRAHQRQPDLERPAPRLLFHPVFSFLSKLLFLIAASATLVDMFFGKGQEGGPSNFMGLPPRLFTALFLGIPALAIGNTAVVYFYFQKPKHAPWLKVLESPRAETLGDVCLFLNMIGYQLFWGLLMTDITKDYTSIISRLSTFAFSAVLIYFPPRIFYLAEDGDRPISWLLMLLANTPIILRIILAR